MRKGDLVWGALLAGVLFFIMSPYTNPIFVEATTAHPYMGGFIKFAILASMGEMLAKRIETGRWSKTKGFAYKAIVWGLFGILITMFFKLYVGGVGYAMKEGYLFNSSLVIVFAFQTSVLMNMFFAPVFMAMHKLTDTYIELSSEKKPTFDDVLTTPDWKQFVKFVLFKTIPFFWIPAHTITFLVPPEYRIILAALYSIALGVFLTLGKKKKGGETNV